MKNQELLFKSAIQLASLIKNGQTTSLQTVTAFLEHIEKHNPKIHAVNTLRRKQALLEAKEADRAVLAQEPLGPLHGVPMTIKDAFRVKGILSTFGALPQYRFHFPKTDCKLVQRLREAGAIILGRTNVPLLSFDWQCSNPFFKESVNPWDSARTAGGSSGGAAAAVAAGFTPLELGSDLGGSIRYPAHCCGILGLRTTDGLLPIDDIGPENLPQAFHHLVSCGPMARDIGDLQVMLKVLCQSETDLGPVDPAPIEKLKIAFSTSLLGIEPDKQTRLLLDQLQANLRTDGHEVQTDLNPEVDFAEAYGILGLIAGYEMKKVLPRFFQTSIGQFIFERYIFHFKLGNGPFTRWMKRGFSSTETEYKSALEVRDKYRDTIDLFFKSQDLWILPVSPTEAITRQWRGRPLTLDGKKIPYSEYLGSYLVPTAVLGTPALTLPIGFSDSELPIGIQIHGVRFTDHQLLKTSERFLSKYIDIRAPY